MFEIWFGLSLAAFDDQNARAYPEEYISRATETFVDSDATMTSPSFF
jgi:hypothetical protein